MVKVRYLAKATSIELTLEQAQALLEEIYNNPGGGVVVDARTKETIIQVTPDVEEMLILDYLVGGG